MVKTLMYTYINEVRRFTLLIAIALQFACGNSTLFEGAQSASKDKPLVEISASSLEKIEPSEKATPVDLEAPTEKSLEEEPAQDTEIFFVSKPPSESSSVQAEFIIGPQEDISSLTYTLNDGQVFTVSGSSINAYSYYGKHQIKVSATFKNQTTSNQLSYEWNVNASGFTLRGDARRQDSVFVLNPSANNKTGMIVTDQRVLFRGLIVKFRYRIHNHGEIPADGFVFGLTSKDKEVLQPGAGGFIGFIGTGGIGLEFDTYYNAVNSDPNYPHIAIVKDGHSGHLGSPIQWFANNSLIPAVWRSGEICIVNNTISYKDEGSKVVSDGHFPIMTNGELVSNHIFFTAATGGHRSQHEIAVDTVNYFDDPATNLCSN